MISLPPVRPASTPAAIKTYGNQYNICPVRKMDFQRVKRAMNRLMAKAAIITIPISVPYIVPMSTVFDSTARGTIVLKAVDIPSIELPVIRPVPVDRIKKPTAVMTVPRIISEKDFF